MEMKLMRNPEADHDWAEFCHQWMIRADTTYLNHGSFGPSPHSVRLKRRQWIDAMDSQPMDFFVRQFEPALLETRRKLADFCGTQADHLIFAENATSAMNVVARSILLEAGDNILLNNHEYGAVHRIWNRFAAEHGCEVRVANLPAQIKSRRQVIDALLESTDSRTKWVVVSHITSPTALIMPIREICEEFRRRRIGVIVDGPHAPAQIDLKIDELDCDFYAASCHKWLSASPGSGFLYVNPRWHDSIQPVVKSWGRLLPAEPTRWDEEFIWTGTRDPSSYLSIGPAIEFLQQVGLESFRERTHGLAAQAQTMLCEEFSTQPIANRHDGWYGSMAHVPLPDADCRGLQESLWREYKIEVPIIHFENRWFIRVSCHLYNSRKQLETLRFALRKFFF
jgi:isopenicillin-N epimerase